MILELARKPLGLAQRWKACLIIRLAHSGYLYMRELRLTMGPDLRHYNSAPDWRPWQRQVIEAYGLCRDISYDLFSTLKKLALPWTL